MKQPVKQYIPVPTKKEKKVWYSYYNYVKKTYEFKEYDEKDEDDDNLSFTKRFSLSGIKEYVDFLSKKYNVDAEDITICSIVIDEEDSTIEFSVDVHLSAEEFAKQVAEYNKKMDAQKQKFAEWEEFNKAKKIEQLKKELQKLEKQS